MTLDNGPWPRIVNEQHGGDPFVKLVEFDGKRYLFDEAALIEQKERTYEAFARWIREGGTNAR